MPDDIQPTAEPHFVTCPCQHCSGHIEFDASGFQKGETRNIECPHCHLETKISVSKQFTSPVFQIRFTSRTVAVFFAFTTLCLASILVWEHLPTTSKSIPPVVQQPISGSDTITVEWGGTINKFRLDEVTFESLGAGFKVRLKSSGSFVGMVSGSDIHRVNEYLHAN